MPKITKHILWKWVSNYLIASFTLFGLNFLIYLLLKLFRGLDISVTDSLIISIQTGLLVPLYLIGIWVVLGAVIKILSFISSRLTKPKPLLPENKFIVEVTTEIFSVADPDGVQASINLNEITSVIVETNDTGPCGMDVWFIIASQDGKSCAYPMGATNDLLALDYYATLPGFELKGMNSTENAQFVCWENNGA